PIRPTLQPLSRQKDSSSQQFLQICIFSLLSLGNGTKAHMASVKIDSRLKIGILFQCVLKASSELPNIRQGNISECLSRRTRHCSRHIGDTVVDNSIYFIHRVAMGGRPSSLDASSLVNRHIDDH